MPSSKSSVPGRPRGRREHRMHVTRRELLAAGRKLFGEHGLYESRVEDLSRHAGVAKGTLYGYFANKTALVEAVVTSGFNELLGQVHREAQGARTRPETVSRLIEAHIAFFEENPDLMRIFHQVRGLLKFDLPEGRPLRRVLRNYMAGLAHVLALKQPDAERRRGQNLETATLLFGAVSGISSTRAALADGAPRGLRSRSTVRALVALVNEFERATGERPRSDAGAAGVPAHRLRRAPRAPAVSSWTSASRSGGPTSVPPGSRAVRRPRRAGP